MKITRWIWIDRIANISIVAMAIFAAILLCGRYRSDWRSDVVVPAGSATQLQQVNWAGNGLTIVLALSTECRFCSANAGLYSEIASTLRTKQVGRTIAIFPQDLSHSRAYLARLKVTPDEIRQGSIASAGAKATPTIIAIGSDGRVLKSWVGGLSEGDAAGVLREISAIAERPRTALCSPCASSR
ncbi:MAG TPA: hypothetical protein VHW00_22185 [Thermoanaerobaculia bacterium]|nr:hypothetical protein [Thermoanaerobaculia bacterium]